MGRRCWVVECRFRNSYDWGICDFTGVSPMSTNYYEAHDLKRRIQKYLQGFGSKEWYKNRFRVVEYRRVKL